MMKKSTIFILLILTIALSGCNSDKGNKDSNSDNISTAKNSQETAKPQVAEQPKVTTQPQTTERPIVLYQGITLDDVDLDIDATEGTDNIQNKKIFTKYEKEYYLYSNNTFLGKANGKIEVRGLDYYWQVSFPSEKGDYEVAISQSYNPYPRKVEYTDSNFPKEFNSYSKVLAEINKEFDVTAKIKELCCVDLDGDAESEYLALVFDEKQDFFAKCLLDSKYKIISYLSVFKEKNENFNEIIGACNLLVSGEVIDINNDGIMEVIVEQPIYEGFWFQVFTYKYGEFDGDFINRCSVQA